MISENVATKKGLLYFRLPSLYIYVWNKRTQLKLKNFLLYYLLLKIKIFIENSINFHISQNYLIILLKIIQDYKD